MTVELKNRGYVNVQNESTFVQLFKWLTKSIAYDYDEASYAAGDEFKY